jgi:thymidylate kinase
MIVEFIGAPGAGKTTLVPTLIDHLAERGIRARSVVEAARPYAERTLLGKAVGRLSPPRFRHPLMWQVFYHLSVLYRLRFFVQHPRLVWQVSTSQRRRPIPADARRHVTYWFFHLVGYYEFLAAHSRSDEALVFDEGFVHRVVQMNASDVEEPDPAQIRDYVNLLPRPDLVVFVEAPWEVCEQRIYRRGLWKRFHDKSPAEVSRYVANSHRIVNMTVDYIQSKGWTVIEVDNRGDEVEVSESELRGKLARISIVGGERQRFELPSLEQMV